MKFTDRYIDLVKDSTDAPDVYHEMMAYFIISCALGRSVYLRLGTYVVYPNLWLILFGATTQFRKSSSMGYALRCLNDVEPGLELSDHFSPEGLADYMAMHPAGYIRYDEFMTLMDTFKRDYMRGMQSVMTSMWDCPPRYKIQRRPKRDKDGKMVNQDTTIEAPFLNICAATTMDWFSKSVTDHDFQGGFLPRFLMVPAQRSKPFKPKPPPVNDKKRALLMGELSHIKQIAGEAVFTPKGEAAFERGATEVHQLITAEDRARDPVFARLVAYFERFCILEAVNLEKRPLITEMAVAGALSVIRSSVKWMETVRGRMTHSPEDEQIRRVLEMIPEGGRSTTFRDILWRSRLKKRTLDPIVDTLIERGDVVAEKTTPSENGGRPSLILRRRSALEGGLLGVR